MKKPANALKERRQMNSNTLLLLITIALFFVMYIAGMIIYSGKGFSTVQTLCNLFVNNAALICVACGMTVVMLTGGIDISVGSLVALDCMVLCYGMANWNLSAPVAVLLVVVIGLVMGLVQGFLVGYLEIQPFIVSMAGMFFARGMVSVLSTNQLSITADINEAFYNFANFRITFPFGATINRQGVAIYPYIRLGVVIAIVVLILTFLILRYTKFGRGLYAVGGSEQSAAMMGLNVKRTKMMAYVTCSLLTTIGGICFCMNGLMASTTTADGFEMDAISSAVIGGTLLTGGVGNVIGSFFGVLINGTINALVQTDGRLASSWPNILTAALLCVMSVVLVFTVAVILPVFIGVYEDMAGSLTAGSGLAVSASIAVGWVALVVVVLATATALVGVAASRSVRGQAAIVRLLERLPLTSDAMRQLALSRFLGTLSTCLAAGSNEDVAMEEALRTVESAGLRSELEPALAAMTDVSRGLGLAQAIAEGEVLEPAQARMLSIGSRAGSTDAVLERLSEACFDDAVARVDRVIDATEPALAAFLTVAVGATLVSVMLPLIGIMGSVG